MTISKLWEINIISLTLPVHSGLHYLRIALNKHLIYLDLKGYGKTIHLTCINLTERLDLAASMLPKSDPVTNDSKII